MKNILFTILTGIITFAGISQNNVYNPFEKQEYKPRIATLSQGKYNEFFNQDSIVQIGSVLFNRFTDQIIGFVEYDTLRSEATLEPELVSRWLSPDPLESKFPSMNPYNFVSNNPIIFTDPDGRELFYAADGTFLGKWGTSTKVRVIANEDVESFKNNLIYATTDVSYKKPGTLLLYKMWSSYKSYAPKTDGTSVIKIDDVIPSSTHEHYSDNGDCFAAATGTLENNDYEVSAFWTEGHQYQMFEEADVVTVTDETKTAGFAKINSELEAGRPLMIGVNYRDGAPEGNKYTDNTTDHFIVLTGRDVDDKGNVFYTGFENVDGGSTSDGTSRTLNKFYPQENGTLTGGTTFTGGMTVTQVRPVKSTTNTNSSSNGN